MFLLQMIMWSEIAMFIYYKFQLSKYWVAGSFDESFADICVTVHCA